MLTEVDGDHLARSETPLGNDARRRDVPQTRLGTDDQVVVVGERPAGGTKAVAIERAGGVAPVTHDQACRAIPGLAMQCVVFVESREVFVDIFACRISRRHEHTHGRDEIHAAHEQHFERVVEAFRIRAFLPHQRTDIRQIDLVRTHDRATRLHPAPVGADGVDLAVVSKETEGLRQPPLRRRVGGEALVEHHRVGDKRLVVKIGVDVAQATRCGHGLVADHFA